MGPQLPPWVIARREGKPPARSPCWSVSELGWNSCPARLCQGPGHVPPGAVGFRSSVRTGPGALPILRALELGREGHCSLQGSDAVASPKVVRGGRARKWAETAGPYAGRGVGVGLLGTPRPMTTAGGRGNNNGFLRDFLSWAARGAGTAAPGAREGAQTPARARPATATRRGARRQDWKGASEQTDNRAALRFPSLALELAASRSPVQRQGEYQQFLLLGNLCMKSLAVKQTACTCFSKNHQGPMKISAKGPLEFQV